MLPAQVVFVIAIKKGGRGGGYNMGLLCPSRLGRREE